MSILIVRVQYLLVVVAVMPVHLYYGGETGAATYPRLHLEAMFAWMFGGALVTFDLVIFAYLTILRLGAYSRVRSVLAN